jgi:hypothetical protein
MAERIRVSEGWEFLGENLREERREREPRVGK